MNSIFDPLGFIAPVTIKGNLLLRKYMTTGLVWDDSPQAEDYDGWKNWKDYLVDLENLHIPRTYIGVSPSETALRELHVFSDASDVAVAAVSYM